METRYSIIIPHYNSPERLRELLGSIPDEPSVQVIVVDDNSTKERDLLEKVIREDGRCEYFTNDTGIQSAGACRNIGLRNAAGKWVLFSDADDFFMPGFLSVLDEFYDTGADIVYFAPASLDLATGKETGRHTLYAGLVQQFLKDNLKKNRAAAGSRAAANNPDRSETPSALMLRYRFCVPWSKMLRRLLIEENGLEFEQIPASNDIMFCTKAALHASTIQASEKTVYCVTKGKGTLMTSPSESNLDVRVDVMIRRCALLRGHLTPKQMRRLGLSGEYFLYLSFKWFGIKKLISTAKIFRKNNVRLFSPGLLNLTVALDVLKK